MASITVGVKISDALKRKVAEINNPTTMLAIHNNLARMCDPYVPMQEGNLAQQTVITPESVTYTQPYARYQYYGEIYGPNIPIYEDGIIIGWFSRPGVKKQPTGRFMSHSKEKHPLATSFWDKAMMRDHGDEFNREIEQLLRWRLMKVGGR